MFKVLVLLFALISFTVASPYCELCLQVANKTEEFIIDHGIGELEDFLINDFCEKLPKSESGLCATIVQLYAPSIIDYLYDDLPPQKVCEAIKLCKPEKVMNVECDEKSACPDGTTCCMLSSGSYGCCPYPEATCCEDKTSCCPKGYSCDLTHAQCVPKSFAGHPMPLRGKIPALQI